MATKTTSKASLPLLPLALTCLALIGFLFTTYWQQQRDYQALQQELNLSRANTKQQIEQIGSQAAMRHSALLKMCEDVARLRDQVDALQSTLRDQTDDLSRQGQKIHGKVDRLDHETQQQVKALENIKTQLKERTDAYMNAMINQERELAKLSAEKAIITAAVQSTATNAPVAAPAAPSAANTSVPASTTTASSTPTAPPVSTPAPAAPTPPAKPHASSPFQAPVPVSTSTLRSTAFNPPTAPLPPPAPDLRGAGATNAR